MKTVGRAVVEAGLIEDSFLQEMRRWGAPIYDPALDEMPQPTPDVLNTVEAVVGHIREALEGEQHVRVDETDLQLLQQYLDKDHQKEGRLILRDGKKHGSKLVNFCVTPMGEYAFPWTDRDSDPDIIYNGESHLKWEDNGTPLDVRFSGARSVFFGSQRAFVVCEVAKNV